MTTDTFHYRYCFLEIKHNQYLLVEPIRAEDNLGTITSWLAKKHNIDPLNVIAISKTFPSTVHLPPYDERRRFIEEYIHDNYASFEWKEDVISLQW